MAMAAASRPTGADGRFLPRPALDRLAEGFEIEGDCWIWQGSPRGGGYGRIAVDGAVKGVHVAIYEMFEGPIPDGLELDHLCRNKKCMNPDHLEAVTHQENIRRSDNPMGVNSRKTHCDNGHLLEGTNLYIPPKRPNRRECKKCRAARVAAWTRRAESSP